MYTSRAALSPQHRFAVDLDLGDGVSGVAVGEAKDDVPVCLKCLPNVARRDLQQTLRPAFSIEELTAFERLCAVFAFNYDRFGPINYSSQCPRLNSMCLAWSVSLTYPQIRDMTFAKFARGFADSAQNRGIKPQRVKVSKLLGREGWLVSRTSGKYGRSVEPFYLVAADGRAMWSNLAGWGRVDLSLPIDYQRDNERLACAGGFLAVGVFASDRGFVQDV